MLAVGGVGYAAAPGCAAPGSRYLPLGNADRIYDAVLRGADLLSVRVTAATQRGSIPATQAVILSTLVVLPVAVLALGARDRPQFTLWDSPDAAWWSAC